MRIPFRPTVLIVGMIVVTLTGLPSAAWDNLTNPSHDKNPTVGAPGNGHGQGSVNRHNPSDQPANPQPVQACSGSGAGYAWGCNAPCPVVFVGLNGESNPNATSIRKIDGTVTLVALDNSDFDYWSPASLSCDGRGATLTATAIWKSGPTPSSCSVSYTGLGGASNSNANTISYGNSLTLANPGARDGYTFTGWYVDDTRVANLSCSGSGFSVRAVWERDVEVLVSQVTVATPTPTPSASPSPSAEPVAPAPKVIKKSYSLKVRVQYSMDSSKLSASAKARINAVAKKLPKNSEEIVVSVDGYVQRTPGSKNDKQLSIARAKSVVAQFRKNNVNATYKIRGLGVLNKKATARQAIATVAFKS